MITIVAKFDVKEDKVDSFFRIAKELVEKTREEKGCISYVLHQDSSNCKIISFIEEWEDMNAIKKHNAAEHFLALVPQLEAMRETDTEVNLYNTII